MHELSIAASILEIAEEQARAHNACSILRIGVRVGALSGVDPESLAFSFQALQIGSMAEKAEMVISMVPIEAVCKQCGPVQMDVEDVSLFCPVCGGVLEVTAGKELQVDSIEIE
jgi:hydrogenase nickel incorporation protein HypA/HybF